MPCYHPLTAYRSPESGAVFFHQRKHNGGGNELLLPCGRCIGCRLERARQWAIRCMHEAQMHNQNCFITLTYNDNQIPKDMSINYRHFQLFMKRLRKHANNKKIRFFMCGEYGEETNRPHYHACIFGYDLPDKIYHKKTVTGHKVYTSEILDKIWGYGNCLIGDVTFESAGYIARYCLKKITGDLATEHYKRLDCETGEIYDVTPEFSHMSLKPGIGLKWLEKFQSDVFPNGQVVVRGQQCTPPKYYMKKFKKIDREAHEFLLYKHEKRGRENYLDNTDERLRVKEIVKQAAIQSLKQSKEI